MKNKKQRKEEALVRQKESSLLTTQQRIMKLDLKYGGGVGASKERKKLEKKLEVEKHQTQTGAIPSGVGDNINKPKKKPYQKPKKS